MPKKKFSEMTPEEQAAYVEKLESNETNQNKYITELEKKRGKGDEGMTKYFQERRMKDLLEDATGELVKLYGQEVFNAVEEDFDVWIKKNANPEHITKTSFFISAFQIVLGASMSNKEHEIYKVLNVQSTDEDVNLTPEERQKKLEQGNGHTPAPLNHDDPSSLTPGGAFDPVSTHKNTDEAMDELQVMIANADTNSFEK